MRLAALAAVMAFAVGAGAQTPAELAERARQVLAAKDAQVELPGGTDAGGAGEGRTNQTGSRVPASRRSRGQSSTDPWFRLPSFSLAEPLLWTVVGLALIGLVIAVLRSLAGRSGLVPDQPKRASQAQVPRDSEIAAELPLHERLAAQGEFGAALHALLLHALVALQERVGRLPLATTARRAVRLAKSTLGSADALATLVEATERVHFGGQSAAREHYEAGVAVLLTWQEQCRTTK